MKTEDIQRYQAAQASGFSTGTRVYIPDLNQWGIVVEGPATSGEYLVMHDVDEGFAWYFPEQLKIVPE